MQSRVSEPHWAKPLSTVVLSEIEITCRLPYICEIHFPSVSRLIPVSVVKIIIMDVATYENGLNIIVLVVVQVRQAYLKTR